jgi:hypothetical protein
VFVLSFAFMTPEPVTINAVLTARGETVLGATTFSDPLTLIYETGSHGATIAFGVAPEVYAVVDGFAIRFYSRLADRVIYDRNFNFGGGASYAFGNACRN